MFGNLLDNFKDNPYVAKLQEQFGLKPEQAAATAEAAQDSTTEALKNEAGQGNWSQILELFNSKPEGLSGNPLFAQISQLFLSKLSVLGISTEQAQNLAAQFLPQFFGQMQEKTQDENGQTSQANILSNFLGGANLDGVKNILGKFF